MDKEIIIKPKFDFKTLLNANLYILFFSKISNLILIGFYILFLFSLLILSFAADESFNFFSEIFSSPSVYIFLLLPFFIYSFIYYASKKQLSSNYRLKEDFQFIFNSDYFQEKGDTFDVKHYWDKLSKIKERKSYFLIYQNRTKANVIPKSSFDENQLSDFKKLIKSINIKSNLKS